MRKELFEPVTYSLQKGATNSEDYYKDVDLFVSKVIHKASESIIPIVDDFTEYLRKYDLQEIRTKEEYILELLSFGVLWNTYSQQAMSVKVAPFITLSKMAGWRKKHQKIKPLIDYTRGILITLFMMPKKFKNNAKEMVTLKQVDHVCKWLEATGEFNEQAHRFIFWRAYWETKDVEEISNIFLAINDFTLWFEEESELALGEYTKNVNTFVEKAHSTYRWREDRIQCTRSRLEYHLNMAGAGLMNRAFRNDFEQTDSKVVLVPGCMRSLPQDKCKAIKEKKGFVCQDCVPNCKVNQLRLMGETKNFGVYIIPHASDLSLWSPKEGEVSQGVIASACVTTLVEGGWELKRYNVPSQCVLLDHCGCKKHWHDRGIPTKFNIAEFERILKN